VSTPQTTTARSFIPDPPIATWGEAAPEVLIVTCPCQFAPNSFVEVSTLPFLTQTATISPVEPTARFVEAAPELDRLVALLQLPLKGFEDAFTTPFSTHIV